MSNSYPHIFVIAGPNGAGKSTTLKAISGLLYSEVKTGIMLPAGERLIEVLRLDPEDTWAYLVLGNLALQSESDADAAERFYKRAYELDPEDAYLLNSYGALKAQQGELEAARALASEQQRRAEEQAQAAGRLRRSLMRRTLRFCSCPQGVLPTIPTLRLACIYQVNERFLRDGSR